MSLGSCSNATRAPLYALALRFLDHSSEAQDAVQDTFLTALRVIDRLRKPQAVGWWLRGILRNVCLRRLRERQQKCHFERPEGDLEWVFLEFSVEEAIDRLAMREWVWSALAGFRRTCSSRLRYGISVATPPPMKRSLLCSACLWER